MAIIVAFQVLVSLPFTLTDTGVKDYIVRSKFTGGGRGVKGEYHYEFMAATHSSTIFWGFLSEKCYYTWDCLAIKLRIALVALNIYFFFIRRWCFVKCFRNLLDTFKAKPEGIKTQQQIKFTFEVLLIGYFIGVNTLPGGHRHFQFWFISLVPTLVELVGLPSVSTFWLNDFHYPVLDGNDRWRLDYQHY